MDVNIAVNAAADAANAVEKVSYVRMKGSYLVYCLSCGTVGLWTPGDGKSDMSLGQDLVHDGQLSGFFLSKDCSRCSGGKAYEFGECDSLSRVKVGIFLFVFLRVVVDWFVKDVDADVVVNDDGASFDRDVGKVAGTALGASSVMFNNEIDDMDLEETSFVRERKVPPFWTECMNRLFHVDSIVGCEGEDVGGEGENDEEESSVCSIRDALGQLVME